MSAFVNKRKPRIIDTVNDEDINLENSILGDSINDMQLPQPFPLPIKFGRANKPAKSFSLRKSRNLADFEPGQNGGSGEEAEAEVTGPVVIRPSVGRSNSTKHKRPRHITWSRMSLGPDSAEATTKDDDGAVDSQLVTPQKKMTGKVVTNKARACALLRRSSASFQGLTSSWATQFAGAEGDERPKYSREYLDELASATPSTPQNLSALKIEDEDGDEDSLDVDISMANGRTSRIEGLEGAVVATGRRELVVAKSLEPAAARILSLAEIKERKERRARMAHECAAADVILLDDSGPENEYGAASLSVSLPPQNGKKPPPRLVPEDEDLGEGHDEFVSEGTLALGRKAEHAAKKKHRDEVAELIRQAEESDEGVSGGDESDASDADRRHEYDRSQCRKGMEGLGATRGDEEEDAQGSGGVRAVPRMKPLPKLDEMLGRMRGFVQSLEHDMALKRARIADMEREMDEVVKREAEVQGVLDQAGETYRVAMTEVGTALPPGVMGHEVIIERGLESLGTPSRNEDAEMLWGMSKRTGSRDSLERSDS